MDVLRAIVARTSSRALAHVLEVCAYALAALWLAGSLILAARMAGLPLLGEWSTILALPIAVVVAAIGVSLLSRLAELYGQHARDLRAKDVYAALREGREAPAYSLYLRPFASTDVISGVVVSPLGFMLERVELEGQLERAVRPIGPLLALGAPLEQVGAGRLMVGDDEWREAIRLLMQNARLIIMLPSSRAGTLEEIDMILSSGLITRTVMIDPPNIGAEKTFNHSAEWGKLQEAFRRAAFVLPDEQRTGRLLFYGPEREPLLQAKLDIDADDRIEHLFRRVLKMYKSGALGAPANA